MMQQPGPGAVPPPMAPLAQQQFPYQQPPPLVPPPQQPYMMMNMNMMPPQSQNPPAWAPQQQQPSAQQMSQPTSGDEVRTLWIGDLQHFMDENYLATCFGHTGEVASYKVIRNKQTSQIEGYGFIEFVSRAAAERVLLTFNGTPMPNSEQTFRLNWASVSSGEKRSDGPDFTIFVGDLAIDVTDFILQETFRARYPSVKGAKVVIDRVTGRTKGYGFVKFADETEQNRAMVEMQGVFCSSRPMRIGPASNKTNVVGLGQQFPKATNMGTTSDNDPTNTTIFVGNLDANVTDDHLRELFSPYGQLVHVKIPAGKRCGFVQFADRSCAEEALKLLHGTQLGGQNIRLSWGRSTGNRQPQSDSNMYYGGYPGYGGQGYDYGYAAAPPQDPSMYYGGYPGYGNYQQSQHQQPPPQQAGFS